MQITAHQAGGCSFGHFPQMLLLWCVLSCENSHFTALLPPYPGPPALGGLQERSAVLFTFRIQFQSSLVSVISDTPWFAATSFQH